MGEVSIIGLDLAKNVFQAHGAGSDGSVVFRRKLPRAQLLKFMAAQPPCVVAMEACASAHHWGRAIGDLGHEVRLIPPAYVKPFVKRQKNGMADAEAIAEAASRPTMRFVAVKSEAQQAAAMAYRTRDLLVRQRTQTINALRGHLAEQGIVVPTGPAHVGHLAVIAINDDRKVPDLARLLLDQIAGLAAKIAGLDSELRKRVTNDDTAMRLTTIPGVGAVTAAAITTFAPPMETFSKGRDFAAWVGLTPRQHSSGGKDRLGRTSKMGQRDIRRLLIVGAVAVVRWAARKGAPEGSWLARMLARKPKMLVAVALANRMARTAWALLHKGEDYRDPVMAAA
ncbi:IS110 family transposase [Phaeovulum sp.]|uniref:IS110 family transposase n=1 Tax=Phaeovulum sp. TaxID=2934796 RepID=UPI002AB8D104|nr:IS110 family transposase [Phaeovulum sp.]MDZ4120746.1 IS110 family transposase [Phaeovulum sp.]